MQEFANRMGIALTTVGRYETSQPPRGEALRRLYKLARRYDHKPAIKVFGEAINREKEHGRKRNRKGQILLNEQTLPQAQAVLVSLWQMIERQMDPVWNEAEREHLMKLADLLLDGGRKELERRELAEETGYVPPRVAKKSLNEWKDIGKK